MAQLIRIIDTRSIDTDGKKVFMGEEANKCARCGRDHSIVYVVQNDDGSTSQYGSTCAKHVMGFSETQVHNATLRGNMEVAMLRMLKEEGVITVGRFANITLAKQLRDSIMAAV